MFVILPLSLQTSSDVSKDSLIRLSKFIRDAIHCVRSRSMLTRSGRDESRPYILWGNENLPLLLVAHLVVYLRLFFPGGVSGIGQVDR